MGSKFPPEPVIERIGATAAYHKPSRAHVQKKTPAEPGALFAAQAGELNRTHLSSPHESLAHERRPDQGCRSSATRTMSGKGMARSHRYAPRPRPILFI